MSTSNRNLELDLYHDDYRIALYYIYVELSGLEEIVGFHKSFRESRSVGGRIRVSSEGINGVLSGRFHDLERYEHELRSFLNKILDKDPSIDRSQSCDLDVKYCHLRTDLNVECQLFPDWQVNVTNSVVGLMDFRSSAGTVSNFDPFQNRKFARSRQTDSDSSLTRCRARTTQQRVTKSSDFQQIQKYHLEAAQLLYQSSILNKVSKKQPLCGAQHLSPMEWNMKFDDLLQQQSCSASKVVLLDCRNCYESSVGYFQVPKFTTILANTRKYSELPIVLVDELSKQNGALRTARHIFMYCTGGVRCERASVFLQAAISETLSSCSGDKTSNFAPPMPQIYQLHGGIQRYLEFSSKNEILSSYFKGKNFVFDLRRTDPTIFQNGMNDAPIVGKCLVCAAEHDDYDNGHAPSTRHEARCCKCRILVLVCNKCRTSVMCWGDETVPCESGVSSEAHRPKLYCGGIAPKECLYMPTVVEIRD